MPASSDLASAYAAWASEVALKNGAVVSADLVARVSKPGSGMYEAVRILGADGSIQLPGGINLQWPSASGTIARVEDIPGGGSGSEFADDLFRVQDDGDPTKELAFQLSGVTTGTTRTLTVPDKSGTLALLDDITGGVSDHGALTGLADDDHTQYHTDARGDARYSQLAHVHDWSDITTGLPTTLAGYGITDGQLQDALLDDISTLAYAGNSLKVLRVNAGETAFELATLAGGGDALTTDPLSQFANTTSAQLAGIMTDETGTGALVFGSDPTLTEASFDGVGTGVAKIGQIGGNSAYYAIGLSGSVTTTGYNIMAGSGDTNLYFNVPTGRGHRFRINNATQWEMLSGYLAPASAGGASIGRAGVGLSGAYFDSSSTNNTAAVVGGAFASNITLTLPTSTGTLALTSDIPAASSEFGDDVFRIQDDGDPTKEVAFQASGITTGTTRTLTVQDADGTIAYLSDIPAGGGNEFADDVFRVQDNADDTKEIAFQASGISTSTVRTITMPDADVDLTTATGTGGLVRVDAASLTGATKAEELEIDGAGVNVHGDVSLQIGAGAAATNYYAAIGARTSASSGWMVGGISGNALSIEGGIFSGAAGIVGFGFHNNDYSSDAHSLIFNRTADNAIFYDGDGSTARATLDLSNGDLTLTGDLSAGIATFSDLTSGRVTYATTGGLLTDSANLAFDGTDLTIAGSGVLASGGVDIGSGDKVTFDDGTGAYYIGRVAANNNIRIARAEGGGFAGSVDVTDDAFVSTTDGHMSLGNSTNAWADLWLGGASSTGFIDFEEYNTTSDAAAPSDNHARVYCRDNGAGKEQLCVRFATGAVQVLATEP